MNQSSNAYVNVDGDVVVKLEFVVSGRPGENPEDVARWLAGVVPDKILADPALAKCFSSIGWSPGA